MQIEELGASTMLGGRVHATDACVVRRAPVSPSLLFWRNWPCSGFTVELSQKSEGRQPQDPSQRRKDENRGFPDCHKLGVATLVNESTQMAIVIHCS